MAETRDVVVRLALKQIEGKVKAPDTGPAKKAVVDFDKAVEDANKRMEESYEKVNDQLEKAEESIKEVGLAREAQVQAASDAVDANFRLGDALGQVGEASFRAARGVAFLMAANEEDMQVMLRRIAVAQGLFDTFKGGFEIIKGGRAAYQALTAATKAQAAANAALNMSLGPVHLAIGALIASLGFLVTGYMRSGKAAEDSANKQIRAHEALKRKTSPKTTQLQTTIGRLEAEREFAREFGRSTIQEERLYREGLGRAVEGALPREAAQIYEAQIRSLRAELEMHNKFREFVDENTVQQEKMIDMIFELQRKSRENDARLAQAGT